MKRFIVISVILLSGCAAVTKDLGNAGKSPGIWVCAGQGTISVVGQVAIYGANGSVTFNCGQGAYVGQGYPASNLPTMPRPDSSSIGSFPPLGKPPPQ